MKTSLLAFLLSLSLLPFAQVSDDDIWAKVDSAFDYVYLGNGTDDARRIAYELLAIDAEQGSFMAKVNALQILGEIHYYSAATDSSLHYYRQANAFAHEHADSSEIAYTAVSIASVYEQLNNYDSAWTRFNEALDIRWNMDDTSEYVFVLNRRAWLNLSSDRHVLAMQDFSRTRDLSATLGDTSMWGAALNGMANTQKKQGNYAQSEALFLESIDLLNTINDVFSVNAAKGNLAMVYKSVERYDEAYNLYPELLEFYADQQYVEGEMFCYANMAVISQLMGNPQRSMQEAEEAIVRSQQVGRRDSESDMLNTMARCLMDLNQPWEALPLAQQAREIAYEGFYKEKQRDANQTLSEIYTALDQPAKALEHFQAYTAVKDSMFTETKSKQILELQTLYETAQAEAASAQAQAENTQLRADANEARLRQNGLISGLVVVLLLSGLILNREISRRRKARELHASELKLAQSEQDRLQDQLEFKNRELASQALHLAQKNEMLQEIQGDLKKLQQQEAPEEIGGVIRKLNFEAQLDRNWDQFLQTFTQTNASFFQTLTDRYGKLSKNEMRLAALLKMNLGSKEIASILNISDEGVKKARYRLRKKMELESSESLESVLLGLTG